MGDKQAKDVAGYRKATDPKSCTNCAHRISHDPAESTCALVEGPVARDYVSNLWHPR